VIAKPLSRGLRIPLAVVLAGAVVATGARGDAAETPAAPREAPLLDKAKGERAAEAYKKFRRALCAELSALRGRPVVAKGRLEEVGLDGVEEDHLCSGVVSLRGTPLASGALLEAGADEVLLQVLTGRSVAEGEQSLAVMRDRGRGYRFVRHMLAGERFEARLRLVAPGVRDVLFLCERRGLGGVYPGSCGFFGRGSFREPGKRLPTTANPSRDVLLDASDQQELALLDIEAAGCGPFARVSVGDVAAHEDRLRVDLVVHQGIMGRGPQDAEGSCHQTTKNARRTFSMEYQFDGKKFRLATPIPPAVKEVLDRQP
jgi:hypothetical protein